MSDLTDLRRRAVHQAQTGNYWAGKCVGLIDQLERVGPAVDQMWQDHQCQRPDLEAIVHDLALADPQDSDTGHHCRFCGGLGSHVRPKDNRPALHRDDCLWRKAAEWATRQ